MIAVLRLLRLPWLARVPSWRSWSTVVIGFVFATDVVKLIPGLRTSQQIGLAILACMVMVVWSLAPNLLWLTRDTRALRVPRAAQEADWCLLLYAGLSIVTPALVLGAIFGHTLTWLVSLALVATVMFGLGVFPRWFAWVYLLALAVTVLVFVDAVRIPLPGDPRFLAWAAPVAIILGVACLQRWFNLRCTDLATLTRWGVPLGQSLRSGRIRTLGGGITADPIFQRYMDAKKPRGNPGWLRVGTAHPVRSIRAAINPLARPHAQRALRRSITVSVLLTALLLVLLARHAVSTAIVEIVAHQLPTFGILFLSELIGDSGSWDTTPLVARRWLGQHGELALLALLPGLGATHSRKRAAVLACLRGRAVWLACTLAVMIATAAVLHLPVAVYPLLVLVALCGLALDTATISHVLAGHPPRGALRFAAKATLFALLIASIALWATALPSDASMTMSAGGENLLSILIALWAAWFLLLAGLAWRGWCLLRNRPHPFLANPS